MNPLDQFRHNPDRTARGQRGQGNIRVHSRGERRYRCLIRQRTFAATADTPSYRLKVHPETVTPVLALMSLGYPLQAIVVAFDFDFDERTVAAWRDRAGGHGQRFHDHQVLSGQVELGHVQADELCTRAVGQRLWMALAMAVPSRLGLGGVVGARRDGRLITAVVRMVRRAAKTYSFPACVDGLASYVTASAQVFRDPVRTGRRGRPRLVAVGESLLGRVIKSRSGHRLVGIARRAVRATAEAITAAILATGTGTDINTAYIERLDATFRARISPLVRRGRATVGGEEVLTSWMMLMGRSCNSCCHPASLRVGPPAESGRTWQERTPAMAADLTDHRWTMQEMLSFAIPLPA